MRLGFTGTRNGMTPEQQAWVRSYLSMTHPLEVHNGVCIGADADCFYAAIELNIPVIAHPGHPAAGPVHNHRWQMTDLDTYMDHPLVTILPAKPFLARDLDIVKACDRLVAAPDGPQREHSGTWYTIQKAREHLVPVTVCWPNGVAGKYEAGAL